MRTLGILLLLAVGIFIATQPYLGIYAGADPAFLSWLAAMGFLMVVHGVALFVMYVLRRSSDRETCTAALLFSLIYLFMVYRLFASPELVPIPAQEEGRFVLLNDSEFKDRVVRVILGAVLAIQGLAVLHYGRAVLFPRKEG